MQRLVNGEGADGLKTLKSWRAGAGGGLGSSEVGTLRSWGVCEGGALLSRVVVIDDARWEGWRVGSRVDVAEECRGVARLHLGAKW